MSGVWLLLMGCQPTSVVEGDTVQDTQTKGTVDSDTPQQEQGWQLDALSAHLDAFAQIAEENNGTRSAGTTGYDASAQYVAEKLEQAGYSVTWDAFTFDSYTETEPSTLTIGEDVQEWGRDFVTMTYSAPGTVTAAVHAVDVQIPPQSPNSSTSGCEGDDFVDFPAGSIAVIQRGTCTFGQKAAMAESAGASAVIIFNEGQDGRQDVVDGTLGSSAVDIPVLGASYAVGLTLVETKELVSLSVQTVRGEIETHNILAETPSTDGATDVVVVGAHLDSVTAGAGINDNASGAAAVLTLAEELARLNTELVHPIRFAFWGAEELGLLGSSHYVSNLSSTEQRQIVANINIDMIASPNPVRFVYDGDGSESGLVGPEGSDTIEEMFVQWFAEQDLETEATPFNGRSDYGPFIEVGIPAGGLFSGAEGEKSNLEAEMYGGTAGEAYDPCYHQVCDGRDNIDQATFETLSTAMFDVTIALAQSTKGLQRTARSNTASFSMYDLPYLGEHLQK